LGVRAEALLDQHECIFCHDFHGGPGFSLLSAETSEQVCLSCHTVSINDTSAAEVHNPLLLASTEPGYITCRECHDAHSNRASNIKLMGYRRDGENWGSSFPEPGIRKETPATVGLTYNVVTFTGPTDFNIADPAQYGPCEVCHDPYHNAGNDCTQCHSHSGGFPKPDCTAVGCHDGNGVGALAVGVGSSHSTNTIFSSKGVTFTCGDCHTSHMSGTIQVPNNPAVGINYNSAGHDGISLGSSIATGATEAEICWNCHDTYNVSEWAINNYATTGSSPYDYGDLYTDTSGSIKTSNWTTGYWRSGYGRTSSEPFWYKQDTISSTHAVQTSTGTDNTTRQGVDDLATIRCSYCHDVHDLNLRPGGLDTVTGKPYLRGSWRGNPYEEDGAPYWDATNPYPGAGNSNFEEVPRGTPEPVVAKGQNPSVYNRLGGYWIDQNNVVPQSGALTAEATPDTFPTASWTANEFGGLCEMCHGNNDGTLSASEINSLNHYNVAVGGSHFDWVSTYNGHANVVSGGSGNGAGAEQSARNIFNARGGTSALSDNPLMHYTGMDNPGNQGNGNRYGFRGTNETNGDTWAYNPQMTDTQVLLQDTNNWGSDLNALDLDTTGSVTNDRYHRFSCSKCHNPHASRLPRLLITNCLDTKHNTWDQNYQVNASTGSANAGRTLSNWSSAQNCHRLVGDDPSTSVDDSPTGGYNSAIHGAGWNTVSPW
jgi:predicted CXXCH cytochrome family protein